MRSATIVAAGVHAEIAAAAAVAAAAVARCHTMAGLPMLCVSCLRPGTRGV